jgi:hypothetical protein
LHVAAVDSGAGFSQYHDRFAVTRAPREEVDFYLSSPAVKQAPLKGGDPNALPLR